MKTKALIIILLLGFIQGYCQTEDLYLELAKKNHITKVPKNHAELKDSTYSFYVADIRALAVNQTDTKKKTIYNNVVLNKFFAEKITNYATNTGDLSFNRYIFNANTSEKTLTIGGSFRIDNFFAFGEKHSAVKQIRPVQKLGNMLSLYVKSSLSNGFSTLSSKNSDTKSYDLSSNIGVGGKFTHIFNGTITPSNRELINDIREKLVQKEVNGKIAEYNLDSFKKDIQIESIDKDDSQIKEVILASNNENYNKVIRKKHIEFYEAIVAKELEYAKTKKLIKSSRVLWYSVEAYIPVTRNEISFSTDNTNIDTAMFSDWKVNGTGNILLTWNTWPIFKESSLKITLDGSVFNTNSYNETNQSPVTFQTIIQDNETIEVVGNSSKVYNTKFEQFTAGAFKGELVTLFFGDSVGLSAAVIETVYGEVKNRNWKLGIPVSLKDKDKKPTVNFELQWREVNKSHFVGISVGYNFGKFVN